MIKKTIFLCHDPGGYDVISPIVKIFRENKAPFEFYCVDPSAKLDPIYERKESDVRMDIENKLKCNEVAILVTGTSWGDHLELEMIDLCRAHHVRTISILDYWSNYRSRFLLDGRLIYPDDYIVMDKLAQKEAIAEGVPSEIISVLGHPGLEQFVRQGNEIKKNPNRRVLLASQPLSVLYGDRLGYTEFDFLHDCVNVLQYLNLEFSIKFHPKDCAEIRSIYQDSAIEGKLYDILCDFDTVIGMNSMALLHAHLMGKKIISYQPNLLGQDSCITNKLGITENTLSKKDLTLKIKMDALETRKSLDRFLVLKSAERIANFILNHMVR